MWGFKRRSDPLVPGKAEDDDLESMESGFYASAGNRINFEDTMKEVEVKEKKEKKKVERLQEELHARKEGRTYIPPEPDCQFIFCFLCITAVCSGVACTMIFLTAA